ncbi:MAG TPA: family 43 glycosylhydrolase [Dongiaceae bacterium]|nr:family 43 glycosylhydrolase [Dongiaceae bacterium]
MRTFNFGSATSVLFRGNVPAVLVLAAATLVSVGRAANPCITSIYTADPSAHVWADGRLYVYPSHDMDPPRGCDLMDRYHVFSTADMVHWRDEGEILRSSAVTWGRPEGGFMWAPDCAYHDGTYYFYYPHPSGSDWNRTWKVGVATSSKPASDFQPAGFIAGVGGFSMIDPAVFVDTDGTAYFYYGGGGKCQGAKLKANMTELDGDLQPMTGLEDFHEATWVFKRNGIYYLAYADNHPGANRLRYATSDHPLGPWTYRGIYLEPTGCDTSHGSVVEFKGQWYQFYHNQSLSGQGTLRSVCVDRLYFNPDGTVLTVEQTKTGVPAVGPAPEPDAHAVRYAAAQAHCGGDATVGEDAAAAAGHAIQNLHLADAYVEWSDIDGGSAGGRANLAIHYASADRAKLRLSVNGTDWSFLNTPTTGGWSAYQGTADLTVPLAAGKTNVVRLTGGHGGVNVDYLTVTPLP